MSRLFKVPLLSNTEVADGHRLASFALPRETRAPQAGQFFMVGIPGLQDPLLKRPFSLHRMTDEGRVEILYRIRGKGTRLLAERTTGDVIEVLGPLGKPFPLDSTGRPVLVGGGLGAVPLVQLALSLAGRSPRIFLGARAGAELLSLDWFRKADPETVVSTENGEAGLKGFVTEPFRAYLEDSGPTCTVYACGPTPMLAAVSAICRDRGIPGYVSLEEHMACGVGACMGCVTETVEGYKSVCREGPVFPMEQVRFSFPGGSPERGGP